MRKIENFSATAPKSISGGVEYCLWTGDDGALYIQIVRNITETKKPGTHSKLLFRISDYISHLNMENGSQEICGTNPDTLREELSSNGNDIGFIKAILMHLFP